MDQTPNPQSSPEALEPLDHPQRLGHHGRHLGPLARGRRLLHHHRLGPLRPLLLRRPHLRKDPVALLRLLDPPGRLGHGVHVGELGLLLALVEGLVLVLDCRLEPGMRFNRKASIAMLVLS